MLEDIVVSNTWIGCDDTFTKKFNYLKVTNVKKEPIREWDKPITSDYAVKHQDVVERVFWVVNELNGFLFVYSFFALTVGIGNAFNDRWSFNSVVILIVLSSAIIFVANLKRNIKRVFHMWNMMDLRLL